MNLIQAIHDSPPRAVLYVTGGGSRAISQLLSAPGASRTVLEAVVPYCAESLADMLGGNVDQHCSEATARAMAMAAWLRARALTASTGTSAIASLGAEETPLIGIGCTAALATVRPRRGDHRVHIAVQTVDSTTTASLELAKGARNRYGEEAVAADFLLGELARACGVAGAPQPDLLPGEKIDGAEMIAEDDLRELLLGGVDAICLSANPEEPAVEETAGGSTVSTDPTPVEMSEFSSGIVFSGAFNPLHEGHRQMAEVAAKLLGGQVEFEISVLNVDKPPLDYLEISRRREQFELQWPLWLTRAATFVEKSRIFPGAAFVVGADTIRRIAAVKYYGDEAARDDAVDEIADNGCRFLVFGRLLDGEFTEQSELDLPENLSAICAEVPEEEYRVDISSTELRRDNGK